LLELTRIGVDESVLLGLNFCNVFGQKIEIYGGQPNKQPVDILTTFDEGRMIWNGYTGAAGWMLRQSLEGVIGASLINNEVVLPTDIDKPRGRLKVSHVYGDVGKSPFNSRPWRAFLF